VVYLMLLFRLGWLSLVALMALAIGFTSAVVLSAASAPAVERVRLGPAPPALDRCVVTPMGDVASCR
jgi:hypothetical protein